MSSESGGDGGYGVREVHHEQPRSGSGVSHDENLTIGEGAVSGTNTMGEVCKWWRVWCSQLSEVYVRVLRANTTHFKVLNGCLLYFLFLCYGVSVTAHHLVYVVQGLGLEEGEQCV